MANWRLSSKRPAFRAVTAVAALLLLLGGAGWGVLRWSPFPELGAFRSRPRSLALQDRRGAELQVLHPGDGTRRRWIDLAELPEWLPGLFIAAEDQGFPLHPGVDATAVLRAALQNRGSDTPVSGASTISMQLARLAAPHAGGMRGKLTEAWNALRIEARLSKPALLELYLNALPFGAGTEGIESASRHFFGHSSRMLSRREALLLAVLPRRPAALHPHEYPQAAAAAAAGVAGRAGIAVMQEDLLAAAAAGRERAAAVRASRRLGSLLPAPHFSRQISARLSPQQLSRGGSIRTSLDLGMQRLLRDEIAAGLRSAGRNRVRSAAGVILDHRSGEVLAYLGSLDYFDRENSGMIDAVQIQRQPGSTLKPFLYALALENGFTAASILPDLPQSFGAAEAYIPQNFSRRFAGPVRLRTALASSLNVPAVHTVVRVGVDAFADSLIGAGFASVAGQRDRVGAGIALGNVEVRLLELAHAYTLFPNDGELPQLRWFAHEPRTTRRVFSAAAAQTIRDILGDQAERVLGFGPDSVLNTGFPTIAKTGTANQFSNIWAVVSDPHYTVGIWMGNIHGETVLGRTGSSLPAAAAIRVLEQIHQPGSRFPALDALHTVRISPVSGMRWDPPGGGSIPELFPRDVYPPPDTWHRPDGRVRYPAEYQAWADDMGVASGPGAARTGPAASGVHPRPRITAPHDGAQYYRDPYMNEGHQSIGVTAVVEGDAMLQLYWNGALAAEGASPLRWRLPVARGSHTLTAVAGDQRDSVTIHVGSD